MPFDHNILPYCPIALLPYCPEQCGVLDAYNARPAYQRNDYLGWIDAARRDATKAKRTEQMLRELERGGVYMGMKHAPSAKKAKAAPKRVR